MANSPRRSGTKKKTSKKAEPAKRKRQSFWGRFLILIIYVAVWAGLMTIAVKIGGGVDVGMACGKATRGATTSKTIPVMEISLNGVTLDEVHENGKGIKYSGNFLTLGDESYENVEFKGRGNFSWAADKKSYGIKFTRKVNLLGMGKSKKWVLIPNSVDDSLMRNDLAYYLMDLITGGYQFRGNFVELKIDGGSLGLYYLIRAMNIGKEAVDLRDPMGILVELDNIYCQKEEKYWVTGDGDCLTIKDAVKDDGVDNIMESFVMDFNILEVAASENNYSDVVRIADIYSFAEYFVISELTANQDAYVSSWFLYKDGIDDKIHAGLAWDFDGAFGNRNWGDWAEEFYAPTVIMARFDDNIGSVKITNLMRNLIRMPEFKEIVRQIFIAKIVCQKEEILDYIDKQSELIADMAYFDARLWGKGDFYEEISYLKWWITKRIEFLEQIL